VEPDGPAHDYVVQVDRNQLRLGDFFESGDCDAVYELVSAVYNLQQFSPSLETSYENSTAREDGLDLQACYVICFEGFVRLSYSDIRRLRALDRAVRGVEFVSPCSRPEGRGVVRIYFKRFSVMVDEARKRSWQAKVRAAGDSDSEDGDGDGKRARA
jgi:hypothetical protein